MAVFPSFKLTEKGEELLNRSIGEGKTLTFTKFELGDGNTPSDFRKQTGLVNKFYEFPILNTSIQKDQVLRIRGYFDNKSFSQDKQLKEIGVFVKIEGNETQYLYSYTNAGDTGDIIPANSRGFYSRTLDVANYIGYATNITFNIEQLRDRYAFNTENEMKVASYLKAGDKVELWGNLVLGDKPTDEYIIQDSGEIELSNGLFAKKVSFKYIAQTIEEMQKLALKVGDIVEVLGYYQAGDGAGHKRVIASEDDGSGVQLENGLWANIVHNGEVYVSWFGIKEDSDVTKNTEIFNSLKNKVTKIVIDIDSTYSDLDVENVLITSDKNLFSFNSINFGVNTQLTDSRIHITSIDDKPSIYVGARGHRSHNIYITNLVVTATERFTKDFLMLEAGGTDLFGRQNANGFGGGVFVDNITTSVNEKGERGYLNNIIHLKAHSPATSTINRLSYITNCFFRNMVWFGFKTCIRLTTYDDGYDYVRYETQKQPQHDFNDIASIEFDNCMFQTQAETAPEHFAYIGNGANNIKLKKSYAQDWTNSIGGQRAENYIVIDCRENFNLTGRGKGFDLFLIDRNNKYITFKNSDKTYLDDFRYRLKEIEYFYDSEASIRREMLKFKKNLFLNPSVTIGSSVLICEIESFQPYHNFNIEYTQFQINLNKFVPRSKLLIQPYAPLVDGVRDYSQTTLKCFGESEAKTLKKLKYFVSGTKLIVYANIVLNKNMFESNQSTFDIDDDFYLLKFIQFFSNESSLLSSYGVDISNTTEVEIVYNSNVEQLDTPAMQYAMELEGVKQDYLEYSLEKFKYDKQLKEEQKAKQEAYELLLQENPNLTWEEFEQTYGNTSMMNLSLVERLEEPQIPESVVKFMEKYL